MFYSKELSCLDHEYFNVIHASLFCVTLQSKNTKHYWHILHQEYPHFRSCKIYHRHNEKSPYHEHGHAGTLKKAIEDIKSHDTYQLNGRKNEILSHT